jgi:hypothetical protein
MLKSTPQLSTDRRRPVSPDMPILPVRFTCGGLDWVVRFALKYGISNEM